MTDFVQLAQLQGLITDDVGEVLYRYAKQVPADQNIVELGSYHGKSTAYLASGARDGHGPWVFAIDAWSTKVTEWSNRHPAPELKVFRRVIAGLGLQDQVIAVRGITHRVADRYRNKPIGLLYVDANHFYDAVMADVKAWLPHMGQESLIIFDDYATTHNPEVSQAVEDLTNHFMSPLVLLDVEVNRLAICGVS